MTSQRVCRGPLHKPKAARPQRHVPKFGVCRLMFQLRRSLPPWPGDSHPTARVQAPHLSSGQMKPSCKRGKGQGLHSASVPRCPLHARAKAPGMRRRQGALAWWADLLSANVAPSLHTLAHPPHRPAAHHPCLLHKHGSGLLAALMPSPLLSLLLPFLVGGCRKPSRLCSGDTDVDWKGEEEAGRQA